MLDVLVMKKVSLNVALLDLVTIIVYTHKMLGYDVMVVKVSLIHLFKLFSVQVYFSLITNTLLIFKFYLQKNLAYYRVLSSTFLLSLMSSIIYICSSYMSSSTSRPSLNL